MTEKRFVSNFQGKKLVSIRDNENNCNVNILQIVEIANKLSNENKQLKKSIKRQQLSNEECSKYIEELVKENEQLKSTNMEMEDYLGRLEERIIELEKENTGDE